MRLLAIGLLILLALVACGSGEDPPQRPHARRDGHGSQAALRDPFPHAPRDIVNYVARLENPGRVEALQVERVIETLALEDSATLADIGSGPGVFALPIARALPQGLVYAIDIEPQQLDALRERTEEAGIRNIVPVLASTDDPHLPPGRIDLLLVVDTYHHLQERIAYFERVRAGLVPGGRLAIVEWKPGELSMGPPPDHKVAPEVRRRELEEAGYRLADRFEFHELHDFEIWAPIE